MAISFSLSTEERRNKEERNHTERRENDAIPSHAGPQTVAHIRVAIRHFCGPVDSGRQRDKEGSKGRGRRIEKPQFRDPANRVQGYTNGYGRVIPSVNHVLIVNCSQVMSTVQYIRM